MIIGCGNYDTPLCFLVAAGVKFFSLYCIYFNIVCLA